MVRQHACSGCACCTHVVHTSIRARKLAMYCGCVLFFFLMGSVQLACGGRVSSCLNRSDPDVTGLHMCMCMRRTIRIKSHVERVTHIWSCVLLWCADVFGTILCELSSVRCCAVCLMCW